MVFEDLHEYNSTYTVYPVCNESITKWREALDGVEVDNAAAICSGGEVSFFGILPSVREKLQLIDHAYTSMFFAVGKFFAVEKLGWKKARKILTEAKEAATLMPLFKEGNEGLPTIKASIHQYGFNRFSPTAMQRVLESLTEADFKAFEENQKKIRFAHGDLSDLIQLGPFDLVYLSNALDYDGRNGFTRPSIKDMLKPGGLACYTVSRYAKKAPMAVEGFEHVYEGMIDPNEVNFGGLNWKYNVVKAPE